MYVCSRKNPIESFPQELERKLTLKVTVTEFHVVLLFVLDHENQKVFHTVSFKRLNYEVDLEEQDALALCLSKLFRCLR